MKRGQQSIGLVILGVVAIIAVIGLVLLFTRASDSQGALLSDLSIGNPYDSVPAAPGYGIANVYDTPTGPAAPQVSYPYSASTGIPYNAGMETAGTRTPAFIVSGKYATGGYASIEDLYACETDLQVGPWVGVPHDQFNCYAVPNKGSTGREVEGHFPQASSAYARPPQDQIGKLGGDMYCYANSVGAEQQKPNSEQLVRENILRSLVDAPVHELAHEWSSAMVNGVRVPVCYVSKLNFPFPQ